MRAALLLLALAALTALAAGPGRAPDELFRDGVNAFAGGQYAEAAAAFKELAERFGKEPSLQEQMEAVYYGLGCSLYNVGQYSEAIEAFKIYAERYPKARFRDEALYRMGAAHQNLDQTAAAIEMYRKLVSEYPQSPYAEDGCYQIGIIHMAAGAFEQAIAAFQEFMKLFPASEYWDLAAAFVARALFEQGKMADAVNALAKLEQRPRNWSVVAYCNFLAFEIGDAAFDRTDYDLALKAYRRVKPRGLLLRRQAEVVRALNERLERLRTAKTDPEQLRMRFIQERRIQEMLSRATELLKKLESLPDYDAGLYHRIGRCFFNVDRYWEARVAFEGAKDMAKDEKFREAAHFDLILAISRLRRFDDLIAEADRYLERYDPGWKPRP